MVNLTAKEKTGHCGDSGNPQIQLAANPEYRHIEDNIAQRTATHGGDHTNHKYAKQVDTGAAGCQDPRDREGCGGQQAQAKT